MTVTQSPVKQVGSSFEQELSYLHDGRLRREQFVGRSPDELERMVTERQAELKRERR
jgi:hypothetical protein